MESITTLTNQLTKGEDWEWKSLGEIATDIYRGNEVDNSQIGTGSYPCTTYGSISNAFSVWFDKCNFTVNPSLIKNPKYFEYGTLLLVAASQVMRCIADCCAYLGKEKAIAGGNMFLLTHNQNPKYLSYALSTHHAKLQKQKYAKEGAIVSISTNGLKKIKIPLPPLEIQKQISETLDVLRELVRELVRELETELKLRKKQYRYYLNKLISDVIEKGWGEYRTLGEIIETQKGFSFDNKKYSKTGLPIIKVLNVQNGQINTNELVFFNPEDYQRDLNKFILRKGEVCITTDGASSGKIAINNHDSNFYISASVCKLNAKKEIIPKYLYYSLLSKEKEIHKLIQGTAVMHLYPEDLKKLKIPLPPLEIQEQIANVLDRLRELCEDLEKEMPKEIELSKQRYKYYKELLIIGKR